MAPNPLPSDEQVTRGLVLGFVGVCTFAMTIPMMRLAGGSAADPLLPVTFVAVGRAAVAGVLAALYLWARRAPWPDASQARWMGLTALGIVFGWPLFLGFGLLKVDAVHASVMTGVLPLATAAVGAWMQRQTAGRGFWACAVLGCALVVGFAAWRGGGALQLADGWLLLAVLSSAMGYVSGARLSARMPAEHVISWVLVLSLPITLPVMLATWPTAPVRPAAWLGFAYVALFSMWLGFFAWYRALALGGTLRVSQVQLLQPFLSMLMAAPLLGETVDGGTLAFALAAVATVWLGRRISLPSPQRARTTP